MEQQMDKDMEAGNFVRLVARSGGVFSDGFYFSVN